MTLSIVPTHVADPAATLAPPQPVPGPRTLGWSETCPDGLTEQDLARIGEAIAAGRAESTRRSYAWQWGRFDRWCTGRGITAVPATPATVCAYLTDFAAHGVAAGTIECACAAIAAEHERRPPQPDRRPAVKAVRRGIRRTVRTAPRRQSRPLSTEEIRRMVAKIDRTNARGARHAALILVGFAWPCVAPSSPASNPSPRVCSSGSASPRPTPRPAAPSASPAATTPRATPSPPSTTGSTTEAESPASFSSAATTTASAPAPSPAAAWPACSRNAPQQPASPPNASADTHCAPGTPPPPRSLASASTASPPRPDTAGSRLWSSTTSDHSKPCRSPPAATSDCEFANDPQAERARTRP